VLSIAEGVQIKSDPWVALYNLFFGLVSLIMIMAETYNSKTIVISIAAMATGLWSLSKLDRTQIQIGGKTAARLGILLGSFHALLVMVLHYLPRHG